MVREGCSNPYFNDSLSLYPAIFSIQTHLGWLTKDVNCEGDQVRLLMIFQLETTTVGSEGIATEIAMKLLICDVFSSTNNHHTKTVKMDEKGAGSRFEKLLFPPWP